MKTPICGLCGKEIHEGPVFIGRTLIDGELIIEHQDCREAQDILDGMANVSKAYLARDKAAEGRAPAVEAELKAVKSRIVELEGEVEKLRSQLADQRWRTSGAEMPDNDVDVVEIRAAGWHTDEHWYIYVDDDLVCKASTGNPYIQWRPLEPDDDMRTGIGASLRRSWEDVQEGRIHPVGELWDGI